MFVQQELDRTLRRILHCTRTTRASMQQGNKIDGATAVRRKLSLIELGAKVLPPSIKHLLKFFN
jgi:hypothetical protein